jgi:hypothetical protein
MGLALWDKAGIPGTGPRSFALRDAFPDVLKGLISVEEALDNHSGADQLARPRTTPSPSQPRPRRHPYAADLSAHHQAGHDGLPDRRGMAGRLGQARPWLQGRPCTGQAADRAPDQTNQAHIAAVVAYDPEPAATLTAQLDRALSVARQDA